VAWQQHAGVVEVVHDGVAAREAGLPGDADVEDALVVEVWVGDGGAGRGAVRGLGGREVGQGRVLGVLGYGLTVYEAVDLPLS